MKVERIRSFVGFAVKAKKVKIGVDNIIAAKYAPFCVLYDNKLSDNSKKKLLNKCANTFTALIDMESIYPNKNCLAIGVCERNLAEAIIKEMEDNS